MHSLQTIFDRDLGYETEAFKIPRQSSEAALNAKVANFILEYDDKNALLILYYGGHGYEDQKAGLGIAAMYEGNGEYGDPQAFFPDIMRLLHVANSDVLLIIDCCYAAKAFSNERHGRRKFELLVSSTLKSPSPGLRGSFTAVLIEALETLLKESEHKKGFSTSVLYSRLYHHPDLETYKPLLFDQSHFDYGKIWLRPHQSPVDGEIMMHPSDVVLDLSIHLSLAKEDPVRRVGLAMNQLAKGLQYLPHVSHIEFQELHAGDADVEMFLLGVSRATVVRKVIHKLRERVKERKSKLLDEEFAGPGRKLNRPPSFHQHLLKTETSATQDWSSGIAQFSNGTEVPVKASAGTHIQQQNKLP